MFHAVEDANYANALRGLDEVDPEDAIPLPPSDFDPNQFVADTGIDVTLMLSEPLGCYFLHQFFETESYVEHWKEPVGLEARYEATDALPRALAGAIVRFHEALGEYRLDKSPTASLARALAAGAGAAIAGADGGKAFADRVGALEGAIAAAADAGARAALFDGLAQATRSALLEAGVFDQFRQSGKDGWTRYCAIAWYAAVPAEIRHFTVYREVGIGAFGSVHGASHRVTGKMSAIKKLSRKLVKGKQAKKLVTSEMMVLKMLGNATSRFVIYSEYAMVDLDYFYFSLPLCVGGDLMYHLHAPEAEHGGFFSEELSLFYATEILLGLAHMHALGILYRDVKPENILLDETGHAKISDMGLCTILEPGKPWKKGRAGTPGYWCPEMLQKKKYSFGCDWWAFGATVYEFATGVCPFDARNTGCADDAENNMNARDVGTLQWAASLPAKAGKNKAPPSENFAALVCALMHPDRAQRLGGDKLCNGAPAAAPDAIKAHACFAGVDWPRAEAGQLAPPWVPSPDKINAVDQAQIEQLDRESEYRMLQLTPEDDIDGFRYNNAREHQLRLVRVHHDRATGKLPELKQKAPTGTVVKQSGGGCAVM